MTKYVITFPLILEGVRLQVLNQTSMVEHTVFNLDLATQIVDEILRHRNTGKKSAYMYHLEREYNGKFKQTSTSVIYIDEIKSTRIRKEGGVFSVLKGKKETV